MKALQLLGPKKLRLTKLPIPEITENEALLKVRAGSICGTDVRMYLNGYRGVTEETPLVLCHEFAGDIVKVGANVTSLRPGMKVSIAPNMGCGTCDMCVSGNTQLCPDYKAFGVTMDGGFQEYVRIPEEAIRQGNVSPLNDKISYQQAALVEPLSCVYNGQKLLRAPFGADTLIIGMGPIGIMHIMVARLFGAGRILVTDLNEDRLKKAKKLFPEVLPISGDVMEGLHKYGMKGVDVCIIAAPSAVAQAQSLSYMNMNGKLLFFGGLPQGKENVNLNMNLLHYKQLTIQGCTKQSISDYRLCARLVDEGRLPLGLIISDSYRIEEYQTAFDNAAAAKGLKHVIEF